MRHKKFIAGFLAGVLCTLAVASCAIMWNRNNHYMLSEKELSHLNLYIHNITCSEYFEKRTVTDSSLRSDAISMCAEAVRFRPIIAFNDLVMGKRPDAYLLFKDQQNEIMVTFSDAEDQLSLDYIHRDQPVVSISKSTLNDHGAYDLVESYYCYLLPDTYALLYELTQTYTGGTIVS